MDVHLKGIGASDCPPLPDSPPRANKSSATPHITKNNFRIYSHNVNGLRDETKLEYIPRLMKKEGIDAYLVQETHLAGDFERTIPCDY
jgi:hypothetical protein